MTRRIVTSYVNPPFPYRDMDWCAFVDGDVEKGKYGWGATPAEAERDLRESYPDDVPPLAIEAMPRLGVWTGLLAAIVFGLVVFAALAAEEARIISELPV